MLSDHSSSISWLRKTTVVAPSPLAQCFNQGVLSTTPSALGRLFKLVPSSIFLVEKASRRAYLQPDGCSASTTCFSGLQAGHTYEVYGELLPTENTGQGHPSSSVEQASFGWRSRFATPSWPRADSWVRPSTGTSPASAFGSWSSAERSFGGNFEQIKKKPRTSSPGPQWFHEHLTMVKFF